MLSGEKLTFLCAEKMAQSMAQPVTKAGGKIIAQDVRSFGVVITVQKQPDKKKS